MSTRWNPIVIPSDHEEWRDIPGYEGLYQVSATGRVKYCTFRGGRDGKRYKPGMEKKISWHRSGYGYTSLTDHQGIEKKHYIHRMLMLAFHPIENAADRDVNHKDGNKSNNALSNLEWATHKENIRHAREVLEAWPERNNMNMAKKLTDEKVREIRRLREGGMFQTEISRVYGVSQVMVSKIINRQSWAHVI